MGTPVETGSSIQRITAMSQRYHVGAQTFITISLDDLNNPKAFCLTHRTVNNDTFPAVTNDVDLLSAIDKGTVIGEGTINIDCTKFARAKGVSTKRVILVHVLKNILIPVITVLGLEFGSLIAFSVVTETVFSWPGMGKLIIDSINLLDRPVIVAYLMIIVFMFIIINLVVDVMYSVLDPRVRLQDVKS